MPRRSGAIDEWPSASSNSGPSPITSHEKNQQMFFLSVCVAEDPENRAKEEKKCFRSRQAASKQATNHSDSYSGWIDLPRSNAVAREARTFAYVPLQDVLFIFIQRLISELFRNKVNVLIVNGQTGKNCLLARPDGVKRHWSSWIVPGISRPESAALTTVPKGPTHALHRQLLDNPGSSKALFSPNYNPNPNPNPTKIPLP